MQRPVVHLPLDWNGYAVSTRTRNDVILWGALGCALVATAHAEYTLATAAHFNEYVALAVPGALDLYVVRALQQRRDVLPAVLVMVAANVASHLITGGVLQVGWQVIAAVGAVAPLIVWRVYALRYTRTRAAGAVSAPAPETAPADAPVQVSEPGAVSAPVPAWVPGYHLDGCDGQHEGASWLDCAQRAPDHVPAEWVQPGAPETYPPLAPVPDLPAEYAAGAVHSPALVDSDWPYLERAEEYVRIAKDQECKPSVRGLRRWMKEQNGRGIGQDRAERLLEHLGVEP